MDRHGIDGVISQQRGGVDGQSGKVSPAERTTALAEHELVRRILVRDADALDELMRRYWTPLVGYASRGFGLDGDECGDVVQEVFIRVWNLTRWDPDAGTVRAFLFRTARNLVLSYFRHLEVRQRGGDRFGDDVQTPPSPLERLIRLDEQRALEHALMQLPARRREALILVRLQGFALGEAAELMNLSKQTVANHVTAAIQDLRTLLAGRPE